MATKKPVLPSTQKYLNVVAIKDGMVVLKDGGIRVVLDVGSLNFALKSEEEQNGMIYQYQQFLNSLKFPLQIVMQSRRLDLYGYLKKVRELMEKQTNDLIRMQTEEYANYIEKLLTRANIMDKRFYVIVPYFPSGLEKTGIIDKILGAGSKSGEVHFTKEKFEEYRKKLDERVNVVASGLGGMGLRVNPLDSQSIIEMLYGIYNPTEAINERMTEVGNLESPIVRTDAVMPINNAMIPTEEPSLNDDVIPATAIGVTPAPMSPQAGVENGAAAPVYAIPQVIQADTSIVESASSAPEIQNIPAQTAEMVPAATPEVIPETTIPIVSADPMVSQAASEIPISTAVPSQATSEQPKT